MILKLENLSKSFNFIRAIDAVDLEVAQGEALGVIGPNGAGKTTLFNLVTGLLRPDTGSVWFDGRDITRAPPRVRCIAGIGRSFQDSASIREPECVREPPRRGHPRPEQTTRGTGDRCLRRDFGMDGTIAFANRRAGMLNLLGRKRLELARALASAPRLLLLDEIAGGLSEAEIAQLVQLVQDIKNSGVTIVWIEHVVHALVSVVSRLVVLNFGRKIVEGEPRTVMASDEVREIYMGIAA